MLIRITNLLNRPRVFTLKNGDTFRLLAYEEKPLDKKQVTEEIECNIENGLLSGEQVPQAKPTFTQSSPSIASNVKQKVTVSFAPTGSSNFIPIRLTWLPDGFGLVTFVHVAETIGPPETCFVQFTILIKFIN